jgi:hypothetical protein
VDAYRRWWPWLREFDYGQGFAPGSVWRCIVAPPLPYVVRFDITLDEVEPARRVVSRVDGDIVGSAVLTLITEADGSTQARLRSSLLPAHPALRTFGSVARPLVGWGHDWVLDQGRAQFIRAVGSDLDR